MQCHALPEALPGFEHINRYYDPISRVPAAKLLPGEYYVTRHRELLVTVLGSCVSACIRDPELRIGGMNHFMLPMQAPLAGALVDEPAARYGNHAMESLLNVLVRCGAVRARLEAKLFGGGQMLGFDNAVGERNIEFAENYLAERGIPVRARDLGGKSPRKVHYYADSGQVHVKKLVVLKNDTIQKREGHYRAELAHRMEIVSTKHERIG